MLQNPMRFTSHREEGTSGDRRRSTPLERATDVDPTTPIALLNLLTLAVFQKLFKIPATRIGMKNSS
jgi:hypothetical protein